ncbi:MAG: restriction endonuclease [Steroidobacteraceae bacterium]
MPARTNEFQQVIHMIQHQLAGDAVVTESKMLTNVRTGEEREVDIVIESKAAGINVVIGIECTATNKKVSSTWVEQMIGKHADLPISKTVLVSKSGYYKPAIATARSHNILALTISEAGNYAWKDMLGDLKSLMLGAFSLNIKNYTVDYRKVDLDDPDLVLRHNLTVHIAQKDYQTSLDDYLHGVVRRGDLAEQVMNGWLKTPKDNRSNSFDVIVSFTPLDGTTITGDAGKIYLLKVSRLVIGVDIECTPIRVSTGRYLDKDIAHGTAKNIFKESDAPNRNIVVTFLNDKDEYKSAIRIPKYKGGEDAIFQSKLISDGSSVGD